MIQECSLLKVLEVFFKEPTRIHFIREIAREITLAQTSVRNHINELKKENLVTEKEFKPFNGLVANRDNEKFLFYKQVYNLYSLFELKQKIISKIAPKAIILFGSYQRGEDIEGSDIDILIISKIKKEIDLSKFEKQLKRGIHLTFVKDMNDLDMHIRNNVKNGVVLYGSR